MEALAALNDQQREAVQRVDRHLLVVAGAGSGKTRVLTHKIVHLIETCGHRPSEILAMTFSNKAAQEMVDRIRTLLPSFEQPRWIGTFHSICLRILKEFHVQAELTEHFSIYDETDQLQVLKRALGDLNLDPKHIPPKSIRHTIDRAKNEVVDPISYLQQSGRLSDRGIQVAKRYEEILKSNGALDFGDLLIRTVKLLRENPEVARELHGRWKRLLIDEYQDTNRIQKNLILELSKGGAVVCAVGDEDQSIYGWRGARVENILEFEDDFPGAQLVKLEQNYRSTRQILEVANSVISHNRGRRGKVLWTSKPDGGPVALFHGEDERDESRFVLDRVEELVAKGVSRKEIALFYRTHAQSRLFEDECRYRKQSYRIFGGVRFYDRQEVKDIMAYLRLALNPTDNIAFTRAIQTPSRGVGEKTLEQLALVAERSQSSWFDAIPLFDGGGKSHKALRQFFEWFLRLRNELGELSPAETAERIMDESGYRAALEKEGTIESESRLDNLEEFLRSIQEFHEESEGTLAEYLDRIALISDTDPYDPALEAITMMTAHNSKGLEFDYVFVVGMEEGIFPHQRSLDDGDPEKIEEERRLCYVAMTRARRQLFLTCAARRRLYHSTQYNPVSRFVGEIPSRLLVQHGIGAASKAQVLPLRRARPKVAFDEYRQESYDDDAPLSRVWGKAAAKAHASDPYPPGTVVIHPDFGKGTVRKCEGPTTNLKLTVQFREGLKKLLLNYCSLEIVEH